MGCTENAGNASASGIGRVTREHEKPYGAWRPRTAATDEDEMSDFDLDAEMQAASRRVQQEYDRLRAENERLRAALERCIEVIEFAVVLEARAALGVPPQDSGR